MNWKTMKSIGLLLAAIAVLAVPGACLARLEVTGWHGTMDMTGMTSTFNLTARQDYITTPDGGTPLLWGYSQGTPADPVRAQYPGPTLITHEGHTVTVILHNALPPAAGNVSIVFPGQEVTATGGVAGLLTQEAVPGGSVTYTFTASRPGTFQYHSGTNPGLQVEMGLLGAMIVRPSNFDCDQMTAYGAAGCNAYGHADSKYDQEVLFVLSEMDPRIHDIVDIEGPGSITATKYLADYFPGYWFINGRCAPDTMFPPFAGWLPTQPYDCMPRMHPGEKLLLRVISAGRDAHPFHYHGNHARLIARNGRLLGSTPVAGADLSYELFTIQANPGQTYDLLFEWTGKDLGWDIYGTDGVCSNDATQVCGLDSDCGAGNTCVKHTCVDGDADNLDDTTKEYCPDHGKPFPVVLPENPDLTFGGMYSGSPFLGSLGMLPPGEGGMNPNAGYTYMWHSHNEKEMVNYDIFPGGMMTMLIVEDPSVLISNGGMMMMMP